MNSLIDCLPQSPLKAQCSKGPKYGEYTHVEEKVDSKGGVS